MEINQADRDALRRAQQKLNPSFRIGNIIEHQVQDPKTYKKASREIQGISDKLLELPKVHYKSLHLEDFGQSNQSKTTTNNGSYQQPTQDLPIPIEDVQANRWLNMETMEFDKMEWMTTTAERAHQEKMKSTTHFDREGRAIAPGAMVEADQQVHDIESLLKLLDSTYQPQITYSLNVISKISTLAVMGYYDSAFDENIHQVLLRECLLRVRHHIDNPNETICQSALKCLRSLLCNTPVDEVFLDRTHPLYCDQEASHWLQTNEEEFSEEKTDNDCVEMDAILALVARTEFLTRIKYLLQIKTGQFSETYKDCIMDILLRMARHSREMCFILMDAGFHDFVINNFMPLVIVTASKSQQSLAYRAVKLVRILAHASKEPKYRQPGLRMRIPEEIMKPIECYYHIDCYNLPKESENHLFILHIETLRLMTVLLSTPDFAKRSFDVVIMNLDFLTLKLNTICHLKASQPISSRISLDWQMVANLFDLLGHSAIYELYNSQARAMMTIWEFRILPVSVRWMTELVENNIIPHLDVSIALATILGHVGKPVFERIRHNTQTLEPILFSSSESSQRKSVNLALKLYDHLLKTATENSHLHEFININGKQRDPKMLASFGYLNYNSSPYFDYKFNNMIENNSPFILLRSYCNILLKDNSSFETDEFYNDILLNRYLKNCTKYHEQTLEYEPAIQESCLMQFEIEIMTKFLIALVRSHLRVKMVQSEEKSTTNVTEEVQNERLPVLMSIAISMVPLISPDLEHMANLKIELLKEVIFYEPMLRALEEIHMSRRRPDEPTLGRDESSIQLLDEGYQERWTKNLMLMKKFYTQFYQPNRFWIFQPIIEYYLAQNKCDDGKRDKSGLWFSKTLGRPNDTSDTTVINAILSFNRAMMVHSPAYYRLVIHPNLDEILCLIGSVFLDDDMFLDEDLSFEIERSILATIERSLGENDIFSDASNKIQSLDIILVDFFNKIVDNYEAASYGNGVFSNFLILFLNPKADKVFKKKLLSEKVDTCLSQIRLTMLEVWCEKLFTKHKEQDPEVRTLIRAARPYARPGTFLSCYARMYT